VVAATLTSLAAAGQAMAFCGFYVARADTKLFNKASQVVLVRDGDKTVITMASDFKGDPKEFAMVVPVPTSITREQIHITEQKLVDHLDGFTAPRLVEYFDMDPCAIARRDELFAIPSAAPMMALQETVSVGRAKSLGVTIEASYTVGEYDILILSAQQSGGLETWLRESGYRIPAGASEVLATYIKQNMRFFVAKVNLKEQSTLGFAHLRPIQVAYESPKFMLPLRLGMVNADGAQELFIYTLTHKGRVEATNYRTVKLRTDVEIPTYVKDPEVFAQMYRALFDRQVKQEQMSAVFQEYAWDMAWCDPCAADPLTPAELRELGVLRDDVARGSGQLPFPVWRGPNVTPRQDGFVTRLHVRYDKAHFPEDLVFQETGDRTNFQGRYVLRHAWTGESKCSEAERYEVELKQRQEREAQTLASLTGWRLEDILARIPVRPPYRPQPASSPKSPTPPAPATPSGPQEPWWMRIWR